MMHAMDRPGIAAVVVTYRNPAMLGKLLGDLCGQTLRPRDIIVVDNSLEDDTAEAIRSGFPQIRYRRMPENSGSAGGFCEGIRMAAATADYVLTLDDDVRMPPDAVEKLFAGMKERLGQGIRVGAVRAVGPCHPCGMPEELRDFAWRGTLLSRAAIEAAGLPVREYFLYADDLEYSARMAAAGFRFFWVPSSVIEEMRKEDRIAHRVFGKRFSLYRDDFRLYYALRNQIHACRVHRRFGDLFRAVRYGGKLVAFLVLFRRQGCRSRLRAIGRGMADGFRSRLGKNPGYLPDGDVPGGCSSRLQKKAV